MALWDSMLVDFKIIANSYGEIVRLKYFAISGTISGYDDNASLKQSGGDVWTSGLIFPLSNAAGAKGSSEAVLLEQGKITYDDSVIYLPGDTGLSGAAIRIGTGSPIEEEYQIINLGVDDHPGAPTTVYRKVFARKLGMTLGSIIGE